MLVGYARVSTEDQSLEMQVDALKKIGIDDRHIYQERLSALSKKRVAFRAALDFCRKGDTLVVWKIDRLSRTLSELIFLLDSLKEKGIELRSLTENIETNSIMGKALFQLIAMFGEMERNLISERTKAALKVARDNGQYLGGYIKVRKEEKQLIRELLKEGKSKYYIARRLGLKSRTPIYKFIQKEKLG